MAASHKVFLIGAGFIGGEVLGFLLSEGYSVTALVRRKDAAVELEKLGVQSVLGELNDHKLLVEQTETSDIVIHSATADDLPSVQSVLEGIRSRARKSGKSTIYLHTSGCSELCDYSAGATKSEKVFHDDDPQSIDKLSDDQPHREVDLVIVNARKELGDKAKIAIILPPQIYGVSKSQRLSIQLPTLTRFALKHGFSGHVGKGLGVWGQVHVRDLARGYMTILHHLESDATDIYANPYFFIENGKELSWKDCAEEIGKLLHEMDAGKVADPTPRSIPEELYGDVFGPYTPHVVGANARNRANRLRALGWEAQEKDTLASLRDEIPIILNEKGAWTGYSGAVASGK